MVNATKIIQLTAPPLRANGLPSKRAIIQSCDALPLDTQLYLRREWRGHTVSVHTRPLPENHDFASNAVPFYLTAYLPAHLRTSQLVWGDSMWFIFPPDALFDQEEVDMWFPSFLTSECP